MKQEEIRERMQPNLDWKLRKWLGDWFGEDDPTQLYNASKELREFLHSQGVVLKVDRDKKYDMYCIDKIIDFTIRDERDVAIGEIGNFLDKAGYVAVESLVKEE